MKRELRASASFASGMVTMRDPGRRVITAPHVLEIDGRDIRITGASNLLAGTAVAGGTAQHVSLTIVSASLPVGLTYLLTVDETRALAAQMLACATDVEAAAATTAAAALAKAAGK